MNFCDVYYGMYEAKDKRLWSLAMNEVKRMKHVSAELYVCWLDYVHAARG